MNKSNSRGVRANSSNKDGFFTFWFNLINFCFLRADIYRNDQDIADKKEIKNTSKSKVNKLGIGGVDVKVNLSIDKADVEEDLAIYGAD